MRMNSIRLHLSMTLLMATLAHAGIPAVPEIPLTLPDSIRQPLITKRQPLALRKLALVDEGNAITQSCVSVKKGSAAHQECLLRLSQFNAKVDTLTHAMDTLGDEIDAAIVKHTISSMNDLAKRLGWTADELTRLDTALRSLAVDGDPNVTDVQIRRVWEDVLARGSDRDIARSAANGKGPGLPGAGTQTQYEDCAIFALANAAGVLYGEAAARASKLIAEGGWRDAAARATPQKAIEKRGLTGGEVVMLAEAFGQVSVVRSQDFQKTLQEGRTIMVNVVPASGDVKSGHEVVLTKTFQHAGEVWFEMMDSNQDPLRRLYVRSRELNTLLQENGVAFRRDPGTTIQLLR
jgi:hypothetical protein